MDAALKDTAASLVSENVAERNRAWRQLYDAHFASVYRLACRNGVLAADAEEIAQKVFCIAHRKVSETIELKNISGWIYGITLRVVSQHYRWQRVRRVKNWMLPHSEGVVPSPEPLPDAAVKNADLQTQVNWVLSGMSPKLREVLVLVEMEEMRPQDVAEILGIPSNTVRSRRRLAHEEFQRRWQKYSDGGAS